jgi:endonuclease G
MKDILFGLFVAAGLIGFGSCSEEEHVPSPEVVVFSPQIEGATRRVGETWSTGDQVGIVMFNAGTTPPTTFKQYNVLVDEAIILEPAGNNQMFYYPLTGSAKMGFAAYSPYVAGATGSVTYTVVDQSTQAKMEAVDFIYAKTNRGYDKTNDVVDLSFSHKLSEIVLNVTSGNDTDLSSLAVTITGTPGSVTANLTNGSIPISTLFVFLSKLP